MAESSKNLYSNEEIIEDITKDLESSLLKEQSPNVEELTSNSGSPKNNVSNDNSKPQNSREEPPGDFTKLDEDLDKDHKDEDEEAETEDTDERDEMALKEVDATLSEDEKEERRIIAETLKNTGNDAFKTGDYQTSIDRYTDALSVCPFKFNKLRAILFCNRSAARMKMEDYKSAIKDCTKSVKLDDAYVKAYLRRAQCYETTDKLDESLADYKKILELDPSNKEALSAIVRLPPKIDEKNEKLKTEMIGKLKDLGNLILKPFGLSTENFQLNQDPASKGYTINFKQ